MSVKLPLDCVAEYHPAFMTSEEATELFDHLCSTCDFSKTVSPMADGTTFEQETGRMMFLDEELTGFDKFPEVWGARAVWPPLMRSLKNKVESFVQQSFHVCPCIYYDNGQASAAFHSDHPAYGDTTWIASISLGEEREFQLRRKDDPDELHSIILEHGSLIVMGEHCQERYEHAVPRDPKYTNPRINLTFRKFGWD